MKTTTTYARKRARCAPRFINPLHIIESQQLASTNAPSQVVNWSLRGSLAFEAVRTGNATKEDVCTPIAVQAIVASFVMGGVGTDYEHIVKASKTAIDALQRRHASTGSSAVNHEERTAIAELLQLHDAMMEIATVRMIEQAHAWSVASINKFIGNQTTFGVNKST